MAHPPARRAWPALVASALPLGAPALAQNQAQDQVPDMRDRWKVETLTIVVCAGAHHSSTAAPSFELGKPRLRDFIGTLQIDGQEGPSFWGTLESPYHKEGDIGVFSGEDRRFIMVGRRRLPPGPGGRTGPHPVLLHAERLGPQGRGLRHHDPRGHRQLSGCGRDEVRDAGRAH